MVEEKTGEKSSHVQIMAMNKLSYTVLFQGDEEPLEASETGTGILIYALKGLSDNCGKQIRDMQKVK